MPHLKPWCGPAPRRAVMVQVKGGPMQGGSTITQQVAKNFLLSSEQTYDRKIKEALLALRPGDEVAATAVGGDFVLPRDPRRPVLLVAAGIGITPFISYLASGALQERDAVILVLARSNEEVAYAEELRSSGVRVLVRLADGSVPPSGLAPAAGSLSGAGSFGADGRLDGAALAALVPDISRRDVYVSGSPASVAALRRAAGRAGARRVRTDSFSGY